MRGLAWFPFLLAVAACRPDAHELPRDPLSIAADLTACAESLPCVTARSIVGWSALLPTAFSDPQTACPDCGVVESLPMLAQLDLVLELGLAVASPPLPHAQSSISTRATTKRVLSELGIAALTASWPRPVTSVLLASELPADARLAVAERVIELGSTDIAPFVARARLAMQLQSRGLEVSTLAP